MQKQDTATLNQNALAEILREKQLKQWWVARQIGVTPLTVNRWLTGKVRRISLDNLRRLAELLECEERSLLLEDETDARATQQEQSQAARLLVMKDTQSLFVQRGQFAAYERLLKAVMHPNLPLRDLVNIYSSLTMASAEQGLFEQARRYGNTRLDYAIRLRDAATEIDARLNLVTIDGASGKLKEARKGIEELVLLSESAGSFSSLGLGLMNLHYCFFLQGDLGKATGVMQRALAHCRERPRLRIKDSLFQQCCMLGLETGEYEAAQGYRSLALTVQHDTISLDKKQMLVMMQHVLRSLLEQPLNWDKFDAEAANFAQTEQHEETALYLPALVLRRGGRHKEALAWLDQVDERKLARVYDPPFLLAEPGQQLEVADKVRRTLRRLLGEEQELHAGDLQSGAARD